MLTALPQECLGRIIEFMDPVALKSTSQTNRTLLEYCKKEQLWKRHCLSDFPFFFWDGQCEHIQSTVLAHLDERFELNYDELKKEDYLDRMPDLELLAKCYRPSTPPVQPTASPTSPRATNISGCIYPHRRMKNPYHPLPDNYYQAYWLIYNGRYTGYVQVLNSLQDRELSAFVALTAFDSAIEKLVVTYDEKLISRYRRGEMIRLSHDQMVDFELFGLHERHRIRRVLEDVLDWAPQELYTRELFYLKDPMIDIHSYPSGCEVEASCQAF
jgi:hypothetical protein